MADITAFAARYTKAQRIDVIELAHRLLESGLVVRTWGNMSVRLDADHFLITPSGRSYETMIPADLTVASLAGERHGPFKPSSEYPMHALTYQRYPEVGAVVHTHQPYASALSVRDQPIPLTAEQAEQLGQPSIPIATYALPGTKALHRNVEASLAEFPEVRAFLLRCHGALVFGANSDEAFRLATALEDVCREIYQQMFPAASEPVAVTHSLRGEGVEFYCGDQRVEPPADVAQEHRELYCQRRDVGAIVECRDGDVAPFLGGELRPYLDDFAQIIGPVANQGYRANAWLGRRAALCVGPDLHEAQAASMVLVKNARAARVAGREEVAPIVAWEAWLMNAVYRLKYSKQA